MRPRSQKGSAVPLIQGVILAILISGLAVMLYGQTPVIKKVPPAATSAASGEEMFKAYCAVCHGLDAKGNGPAVPALKKVPGDLTELTKNAGGKFPELRVYHVIQGEVGVAAHGSKDMPIWGEVFREMRKGDADVKLRVRNLTKYLESLQK
jgi:mono/diheme cytochrome c family protein